MQLQKAFPDRIILKQRSGKLGLGQPMSTRVSEILYLLF
jgi:hypothetical protein